MLRLLTISRYCKRQKVSDWLILLFLESSVKARSETEMKKAWYYKNALSEKTITHVHTNRSTTTFIIVKPFTVKRVCHKKYFPSWQIFTLCLHPCAHQSEWVASQLTTRAGNGPAAHQHQNSWVSWVFGVVRQPGALQTLSSHITQRVKEGIQALESQHYSLCSV